MKDYLEIYEKFKDVKDIQDYINDVQKLREYFYAGEEQKMKEHIKHLMKKYLIETIAWNVCNPYLPTSFEQSFINAENFLRVQGAKIITEKIFGYQNRLTSDEISFIESMIKPME